MGLFSKSSIQYEGYARVVAEVPLNSCHNEYLIRPAGSDELYKLALKSEHKYSCDLDFIRPGDMIKIKQYDNHKASLLENNTLIHEVAAAQHNFERDNRAAHADGNQQKAYMVLRSAVFNHELRTPTFLLVSDKELVVSNLDNSVLSNCTNLGDFVLCSSERNKSGHLSLIKNLTFEYNDQLRKESERSFLDIMNP